MSTVDSFAVTRWPIVVAAAGLVLTVELTAENPPLAWFGIAVHDDAVAPPARRISVGGSVHLGATAITKADNRYDRSLSCVDKTVTTHALPSTTAATTAKCHSAGPRSARAVVAGPSAGASRVRRHEVLDNSDSDAGAALPGVGHLLAGRWPRSVRPPWTVGTDDLVTYSKCRRLAAKRAI